jgi:hypothetical protein
MSVKFLLRVVFLTMLPFAVYPQSNSLKLETVHLWSGHINIAYERTLARSLTAQIDFDMGTLSTGSINGKRDYTLETTAGTLSLRFYPFRKRDAPIGFFIGEWLRYAAYRERYENLSGGGMPLSDQHSEVKSFGLKIGYKLVYRRFCLEPVIGISLISQMSDNPTRILIPAIYTDNLTKNEQQFYQVKLMIGYMFGGRRDN